MISSETRVQIRHWFYAEHWKIGTIASELGVHPDAVRNAIESERFKGSKPLGASVFDPYMEFIRHTLDQHPRLRATRIYQMIHDRGYSGSVVQLRRTVARLRPQSREPFLQLQTFAGEQAQVDWAHFGHVMVGRAKRALSCFVMTLSYSRVSVSGVLFDQTMENFLRGHVHAFQYWQAAARDSLRQSQERGAGAPRQSDPVSPSADRVERALSLLPRPCQVRAGNQKGRVERAIRYVRDSFWAGRTLPRWPNAIARHCSGETRSRTNGAGLATTTAPSHVFAEEQSRLLPPPLHAFATDDTRCGPQNHLCSLRSQRLFHPAGIGRTATDFSSLRHSVAFSMAHSKSPGMCAPMTAISCARSGASEAVLKIKRKAFHSTPGGR